MGTFQDWIKMEFQRFWAQN